MANLQNFTLDTEFTAVRQLPNTYTGSISIPNTNIPAGTLSKLLASATITVPTGAYSDICLLYYSKDGVYHLTHSISEILSTTTAHRVAISVTRNSSTSYLLAAYGSNPSTSSQTIPAFTSTVWLKLLMSPFGA